MRIAEINIQTSETISRIIVSAVLRDLRDSVNAIGGFPANEYERGSNDTIRKVLTIIEEKQSEVGHGS